MIEISQKCIGCGKCVPVCPFAAVQMIEKKAVINEACTLCGACVQVCPVAAITIAREESVLKDFSDYKGVWVFVEFSEPEDKESVHRAAAGKASAEAAAEGGRKIKPVTFE